jgi:hypothetical protein
MVWTLGKLEMQSIDLMSRQQLLEAIRPHQDYLAVELRDRLEEQPLEWLRLLLLAARLIHVLRKGRNGAGPRVP